MTTSGPAEGKLLLLLSLGRQSGVEEQLWLLEMSLCPPLWRVSWGLRVLAGSWPEQQSSTKGTLRWLLGKPSFLACPVNAALSP